jgi:hypothetical protein
MKKKTAFMFIGLGVLIGIAFCCALSAIGDFILKLNMI